MKPQITLALISCLMLASCATILNKETTAITFHMTGPALVIHEDDSLLLQHQQLTLTPPRSNEPLHVTILTDSTQKHLHIPSSNSFLYYANILCNYGLGMLVDKNNPRRYSYPRDIYVDNTNSTSRYTTYGQQHQKGEVNLHLSLPYINSFILRPAAAPDTRKNTGFLGFALGLDYYYHPRRFIQLSGNAVTDFLVPVPAPVDYGSDHESMYSSSLNLLHYHVIRHWSAGYGICFAHNTWRKTFNSEGIVIPPPQPSLSSSSNAIGGAFALYYRFTNSFHLGALYRPMLWQLTSNHPSGYESLFSIDLAWKIKL